MAESENLNNIIIQAQAMFLINALKDIYEFKINRNNLKDVLFLAYGLNKKEAEILINTAKGKITKSSNRIIRKSYKELMNFLSIYGKSTYLFLIYWLKVSVEKRD
jgi:fumarate hydratase class II